MAMASKNGKKKMGKLRARFSWKNVILYGFLLFFSLFVFSALSGPYESSDKMSLSQVVALVKKGDVSEIIVNGDKLQVTEKNGTKVEAVKETGSDVYSLFKNAGVSLGEAKITVK